MEIFGIGKKYRIRFRSDFEYRHTLVMTRHCWPRRQFFSSIQDCPHFFVYMSLWESGRQSKLFAPFLTFFWLFLRWHDRRPGFGNVTSLLGDYYPQPWALPTRRQAMRMTVILFHFGPDLVFVWDLAFLAQVNEILPNTCPRSLLSTGNTHKKCLLRPRCAKVTSLHCDYRLFHKLSPRQEPSTIKSVRLIK